MALWDGASGLGRAPALLCGLPGDVEAERDVGPAVAVAAQAGDGVLDGSADLVGDGGHVRHCFDVACCDAAAVGAYDAPEEGGVLVVLDDPSPLVWCQEVVDGRRLFCEAGCHRSHLAAQSLHSPFERGMQLGFSVPHVGQVRRARR